MLPPRKTLRGQQMPPAAVTGPAWDVTPALTKRLCFREQIEWAERVGVLEAVMVFMQSRGYAVEHCEDGEAALARVRGGGINLVLTDRNMQRMDGLALCGAVR